MDSPFRPDLAGLLGDEAGLSALEYLALAALAAGFLYGVLTALFGRLQTRLTDVANQL